MTKPSPHPHRLVLASSSQYRRSLLERLGLNFETASPDIDESSLPGEPADALALRLSAEKSVALMTRFPDALILGSDQVAVLEARRLTKPGCRAQAIAQLHAASGKAMIFYTGICLLDTVSGEKRMALDKTTVHFRALEERQIANYVDKDEPYDCAGSFKFERLGIALFDRIESEDPNALIGLPLIQLVRLLESAGMSVI
jgi:septum formation protein